ncbi:hypothetical protein [Haloarcula nitratireducens]|uniref:Uncharacterized protein n=1 Tax=Haloarcula nitratireducens TaxID=2487749 RepID=A0AAW4PAZ7_9EURY|nr:hypothetical protein [Halomicroarcula nitratireducens]MBX0294763.1 hypothetical protein [Halomicroarcula nitratireducens]
MDRLSSCYFCGGALDASLAEYPIVPQQLRSPDAERRTVVLCQTCRRKLGTVLEEVVAAAEESDAAGTADARDANGDRDAKSAADAAPMATDETTEVGDTERGDDLLGDAAGSAGIETADDGTLLGTDDEAADSADPTAAETPPATGESPSGADAQTGDDTERAGSDGGDSDDASLTRLEYNRVMRLVQNRQLPVEKAEIREVAVNAYDIEPEEFDAITDAAVERGLIGEADGRFVPAE